jgi:hypothetical protein
LEIFEFSNPNGQANNPLPGQAARSSAKMTGNISYSTFDVRKKYLIDFWQIPLREFRPTEVEHLPVDLLPVGFDSRCGQASDVTALFFSVGNENKRWATAHVVPPPCIRTVLTNDRDWIPLADNFCDRRIRSIAASVVFREIQ